MSRPFPLGHTAPIRDNGRTTKNGPGRCTNTVTPGPRRTNTGVRLMSNDAPSEQGVTTSTPYYELDERYCETVAKRLAQDTLFGGAA